MNIETARSNRPKAREAAAEIKARLEAVSPRLVLYFASSSYPPDEVALAMEAAFPGAAVFGCTTAGEIISGEMLKNSIVAMGFNGAVIEDVRIETLADVHGNAAGDVAEAFARFEKYFDTSMLEANPAKYVGIILVDGLSGAEEKLMEKIGELTGVNFIGGSAGDDLKFQRTHVFANGEAHTNAAVLGLIKSAVPFDFIKTQSFGLLHKTLIATKVDAEKREVLEFNDLPAAAAYADAIGVPLEELADHFMTNPVGLMASGELYVRSPQQVRGGGLSFYCAVGENKELQLLSSTDIIDDTRKALTDELTKVKRIEGLVNFNCILRTLELEKKGQTDAYGRLFADIPTIGFSSYGEEFHRHINQTSTMLVFT